MAVAIGPDYKSAVLALSRFGYGARGPANHLAAAARDPRAYLKAEIEVPDIALAAGQALVSSRDALQALFEQRRAAQQDGRPRAEAAEGAQSPSHVAGLAAETAMQDAASERKKAERPVAQQLFRAEALARFHKVAAAEAGFVERLVQFWSNHFCVSATKGGLVRITAGSFEREAIRPHVLGRFADMLKAVVQHPAMLAYLDNARSFGPTSIAGRNRKRGLNENLAREILELHTLGADGGYAQSDVTSLAQILTGWTFAGAQGQVGEPGLFTFFARAHEPGDRRLLGKTYKAAGITQGETALADLARHPATAHHVATKLARHFVADDPPVRLIAQLEKTFIVTGGDLKALAVALIEADDAWDPATVKIRAPYEFLMSAMRAVGHMPQDERQLLAALHAMGMPLWQPPGPNGWPDTVAAWATPKGVKSRLDVAAAIAARLKEQVHPKDLLDACLRDVASTETRQAIARAESRQQGLALFLMSPEFQWR
jgi:uncharacterized protein (DUF1800 family)